MAQSKYFPNLSNGVDDADVEQIEAAFAAVEEDMNAKISDITDGAVTTAKIADNAVTADKIADGVIPTKVSELENDSGYLLSANAVGKKGTGEGAEIFNKYETNEEDGNANVASGKFSHAEGENTQALGEASHSEGANTQATSIYSHAEGYGSQAKGEATHAEGMDTVASAQGAHAEGLGTTASGSRAHAEGFSTKALGTSSHTEGQETQASGEYAHAEGERTTASSHHQHVEGRCNIEDTENKYIHIVGNGNYNDGEGTTMPSNAHTVDWNGVGWFAGGLKVGGSGQYDSAAKDIATIEQVTAKANEAETEAKNYTDTKLAGKADRYTINTSVTGNTLLLADKSDTQLLSAASAALTLTLPETVTSGYECFFSFKSGATATSITAPSGIVWTGADCNSSREFIPLANTVYEVGIRCIGFASDGTPYISARVGAC